MRSIFLIRRRHLTLVEILIAITILVLIGGIIGISVTRALKEQKFRTEVGLVVETLRIAQDLMLILGADVHFRVKAREDKSGIEYGLEVEGGVPEQWEAMIKRTHRLLKETHGVSFRELQPFPIVEGQLDIRFQSGGAQMSKGVLRLSTHENEKAPGAMTMAICLKGYPHPIVALIEGAEPVKCEGPDDADVKARLTSYTVQEILEDDELNKSSEPSSKQENPPAPGAEGVKPNAPSTR